MYIFEEYLRGKTKKLAIIVQTDKYLHNIYPLPILYILAQELVVARFITKMSNTLEFQSLCADNIYNESIQKCDVF